MSTVFGIGFKQYKFIREYCKANGLEDGEDEIEPAISKLQSIQGISLGVIELSQALSIDDVTDIFIRINSQGVVLSRQTLQCRKSLQTINTEAV